MNDTATTTYTRTPAWRTMGEFVRKDGGNMTSAEAMKAAGLAGWDVRKEAMSTASGLIVPNRVATVRNDPATGDTVYLGYVGHGYAIHQNEDMFDFLDTLVDQSGAHYDTAGLIGRGHKVFTTLQIPEGIKIAGEDAHDLFILATNGHDGFTPFVLSVVPIRLACTNQLTAAIKGAQQQWKIRHTVNMAGRIIEARHSLELTFEYMDAFTAEMEQLLDQSYTEAQFAKLTKALVPNAKREGGKAKVQEQRDTLTHLFHDAPTNAFGRGTKYAAYNAVTEWADWFTPMRGDKDGSNKAARIMDGGKVQTVKDFALASLSR